MPEVHILSGGVDSTSVLYRRLAETVEDIHVLHVRAGNPNQEPYETVASRKIVLWLTRNVRSLTYHEFVYGGGKSNCANGLFAICGLAVGQYVIKHPYIATAVQGTNGGEADQSEGSLFRNRYREGVCAAVCDGYAPAPRWIYPNTNLTKLEAFRLLPPDLRALCVACAGPMKRGDDLVACGQCPKCLELQAVKDAV